MPTAKERLIRMGEKVLSVLDRQDLGRVYYRPGLGFGTGGAYVSPERLAEDEREREELQKGKDKVRTTGS
jgi:hypothetical protein